MFRRKRRDSDTDDEPDSDLELEDDDVDAESDLDAPEVAERVGGPYDVEDLPQDGVNRVDLGSLMLPLFEGIDVRVDVDPQSDSIVSVTLAGPSSAMQLMAFAAPRTSGIWPEVRAEIIESLTAGGGQASEVPGPYGVELRGLIPTDVPGQLADARFIGVDGPRWFLRALITGAAAIHVHADPELLAAFGLVAVVRGQDAMAVRDALPLRLPVGAVPIQAPDDTEAAGTEPAADPPIDPLRLPERGPEITETR